jgi:glycosyltransferase involved in cell wall biosynthesis
MNGDRQRVLHYYARYLEHPSGVTDALNHWAEASIRAGDDVEIVAATPRGADTNEFALRDLTSTTAHVGRGRNSWIPVGLFIKLRKNDLLVLHEGWVLSNVVAMIAAQVRGAKVVVMPHGVYEEQVITHQKDVGSLRRSLDRWVLRRADAVHIFYPGERDVVRALEPSVDKFIVAPNGTVDPGKSAEWNGTGDYFLWMGRFDVYHKGLDMLLDFWANLPAPAPKLMLAGPNFMDGREKTLDLIEHHKLKGVVEVRGRVSGAEKDALLAACRAYIHPSRWESCSIMLLEALAAGVPSLISSRIHAAHELGPIGVLHSTDFTADAAEHDGISRIDRNAALGARAAKWARATGSWQEMGELMVREQRELGLREKRGTRG